MQIVPGDVRRTHEMFDLLAHVLGNARIPRPARQGLGHARRIAPTMQQFNQSPPCVERGGARRVAFDARREPVRGRLVVPEGQPNEPHLIGGLGPGQGVVRPLFALKDRLQRGRGLRHQRGVLGQPTLMNQFQDLRYLVLNIRLCHSGFLADGGQDLFPAPLHGLFHDLGPCHGAKR